VKKEREKKCKNEGKSGGEKKGERMKKKRMWVREKRSKRECVKRVREVW
jgi:ribosomal protein L19E